MKRGGKSLRLTLVLIVALIMAMSISPVAADHEHEPYVSDISLTIPQTYASCVDEVLIDTISTSGTGARYIEGQIIVEYVTDSGRVLVPADPGGAYPDGFYPVAQFGDINLDIFIPPISHWPVQSNGTAEIHVDVQIGVFTGPGGVLLGSIGPGHDYDVFCLTPPPPPPPPPPSDGGEGCTPGYFKQAHHFDSWTGYAPTDSFDSAFGVDGSGSYTLADAAAKGGGGEFALMRHAVAALLNAASPDVDYGFSESEVIQIVQNAYATGEFEAAKNLFEEQNEMGCPLN